MSVDTAPVWDPAADVNERAVTRDATTLCRACACERHCSPME